MSLDWSSNFCEQFIKTQERNHRLMLITKDQTNLNELFKILNKKFQIKNPKTLFLSKNSKLIKNSKLKESNVNYVNYIDSENILGQTYEICVFADMDHLTPNLMVQCIETVGGKGIVLFFTDKLIKNIDSIFIKRMYKSLLETKDVLFIDELEINQNKLIRSQEINKQYENSNVNSLLNGNEGDFCSLKEENNVMDSTIESQIFILGKENTKIESKNYHYRCNELNDHRSRHKDQPSMSNTCNYVSDNAIYSYDICESNLSFVNNTSNLKNSKLDNFIDPVENQPSCEEECNNKTDITIFSRDKQELFNKIQDGDDNTIDIISNPLTHCKYINKGYIGSVSINDKDNKLFINRTHKDCIIKNFEEFHLNTKKEIVNNTKSPLIEKNTAGKHNKSCILPVNNNDSDFINGSFLFKNLIATDKQKHTIDEIEVLISKNKKSISAITAQRGRGKSATLGILIVLAMYHRKSNLLIISPSIMNIQTVFQYILKGFKILDYNETHFKIFYTFINKQKYISGIILKMNNNQQIIKYKSPQDNQFHVADVVFIDEAASIPIIFIDKFLKSNLIIMSSTVDGYEGTGRNLVYKLFKELEDRSKLPHSHSFKKYEFIEPIRYSKEDNIEKWLNHFLLLNTVLMTCNEIYHPDDCDLFLLNKETFCSYTQKSEIFLTKLISIFTSSHYKNTPDDIFSITNQKNHNILFLMPKIDDLNDIDNYFPICVLHVVYEFVENIKNTNKSGNLTLWTLYETHSYKEILTMKGFRIVRIATHPLFQNKGFGTKAINTIINNFVEKIQTNKDYKSKMISHFDCLNLFDCDYISVSFGITLPLIKFWKKHGLRPVYIATKPNKFTGAFSSIYIYIKSLNILNDLYLYNRKKFIFNIPRLYRDLEPAILQEMIKKQNYIISILDKDKKIQIMENIETSKNTEKEIITKHRFTEDDKRRIGLFCCNRFDFKLVEDLIERIAQNYFLIFDNDCLSNHDEILLIIVGLQFKLNDNKILDTKDLNSQINFRLIGILNKIFEKML